MATYIEDEEVSQMIERLAKESGTDTTSALRHLLQREFSKHPERTAEERFAEALAFVNACPTERTPIKPGAVESLYTYLDVD